VEYEPGQKPVQRTSMVGGLAAVQQTAGTGQYLHEVEDRRAIKVRKQRGQSRSVGWCSGMELMPPTGRLQGLTCQTTMLRALPPSCDAAAAAVTVVRGLPQRHSTVLRC
jgi:hypothetical protein